MRIGIGGDTHTHQCNAEKDCVLAVRLTGSALAPALSASGTGIVGCTTPPWELNDGAAALRLGLDRGMSVDSSANARDEAAQALVITQDHRGRRHTSSPSAPSRGVTAHGRAQGPRHPLHGLAAPFAGRCSLCENLSPGPLDVHVCTRMRVLLMCDTCRTLIHS